MLNELQNAQLTVYSLNSNLEVAQSHINELDKLVTNRDAHISLEWDKNLKAFQRMNVKLVGKDKKILGLFNNINALMGKVNKDLDYTPWDSCRFLEDILYGSPRLDHP